MQPKDALVILNKTVKLSPEITDMMQRWRDVYHGISLHTTGACPRFKDTATGRMITPPGYYGPEYQYLFDNYLLSRHPREDDATRNWRYSQYRPLTKAPFGQVTEIITGAIFQDSNYTLELQDKQDEDYIWLDKFSGYDLIGYFANIGFKNMIEDPNGVFLRIPTHAFNQQQTEKVDVDIWFVHTKDMVLFTATDLIFKWGEHAWWIDNETIWRFSYNAGKKEYYLAKADAEGYYAHMLGRIPVSIAGGVWNTQGYYDSYFSKAKAAADDFISSYSAAQLVDKEASHPFIVSASAECMECNGKGRVQHECKECEGGMELHTCSACHGSGLISRNPGQYIIIPHEKMKDGLPIQIVNPDISINTHHRDVCAQVMELIIEALHLQRVDAAQSGTAKAIDQERLYKFISTISNDLFDKVIRPTLRDIIAYRNATGISGQVYPVQYPFRLVKPTQFQIKTSTDLLAEYNEGTKANMPVFIRQRMALDFVDKQYSGDDVMRKKAQLIMELDELSVFSSMEILDMKAADAITPASMIYSRKLPLILDTLIRDYGSVWFIQADTEVIKQEVEDRLTEYLNTDDLMKTLLN